MKTTFQVGNHYLSVQCDVACGRNHGNSISLAMWEGNEEIYANWHHIATEDEIEKLASHNVALVCEIMTRLQANIDSGKIYYFEKHESDRRREIEAARNAKMVS